MVKHHSDAEILFRLRSIHDPKASESRDSLLCRTAARHDTDRLIICIRLPIVGHLTGGEGHGGDAEGDGRAPQLPHKLAQLRVRSAGKDDLGRKDFARSVQTLRRRSL